MSDQQQPWTLADKVAVGLLALVFVIVLYLYASGQMPEWAYIRHDCNPPPGRTGVCL